MHYFVVSKMPESKDEGNEVPRGVLDLVFKLMVSNKALRDDESQKTELVIHGFEGINSVPPFLQMWIILPLNYTESSRPLICYVPAAGGTCVITLPF